MSKPARLYPKREKKAIRKEEIRVFLFLSALIVLSIIAVVFAIASKSFYYTPLA